MAFQLSSFVAYTALINIVCLIPIVLYAYRKQSNRRAEGQVPKGCRRLGLQTASNLEDEHNANYSQRVEPAKDKDGLPTWRVKALVSYPIKSCRGVELDTANVVGTGIEYDRQFCLAEYITPTSVKADATEAERAPRWVFRTLREGKYNNSLTQIQPEIWVPDPKSPTYSTDLDEIKWGGVLLIRYPKPMLKGISGVIAGLASMIGLYDPKGFFKVPLNPSEDHDYPRTEIRLWRDFPQAFNLGIHLPDVFKEYIGAKNPVTIFRTDPAHYREVHRCAPRKSDVGFQPVTGFADTYPLHLLNLASVRDLGTRITHAIPKLTARRFRPNVLIQGPGPYEEDAWKRIRIGGVEIFVSARTTRCRLPNVDPDSGERHGSEPDKTMRSYRCIDVGDPKKACLGMQMVPSSLQGKDSWFFYACNSTSLGWVCLANSIV
jgi:uncharacterized protein YcbX